MRRAAAWTSYPETVSVGAVKRATITALGVVALLVPPAQAAPREEVAEAGGVRAELRYVSQRNRVICRDFSISITRSGAVLVSESIRPRRESGIAPGRPPGTRSLRVVDLNGDGEQEVLVDLYTGGAHCCFYTLVYGYSIMTSDYERLTHDWGDVGYTLASLGRDRNREFVSGDFRFAFLFTSFAESRFPIQIWQYGPQGLTDATRRFPRQIRADIRRLRRALRDFVRERIDLRGVVAAIQADRYLLGRRSAARGWTALRRMAARGQLRRPRGASGPAGRRYLRSLRRHLQRFGYAR